MAINTGTEYGPETPEIGRPAGNRFRRHFRIAGGLALLILGAVCSLPGVPGPGILMVIAALVILSEHFRWANTALHWLKTKAKSAGVWPPRLARFNEKHSATRAGSASE